MKASLIRKYGKIALDEVEKPCFTENEVLIKVIYASIS